MKCFRTQSHTPKPLKLPANRLFSIYLTEGALGDHACICHAHGSIGTLLTIMLATLAYFVER